MNRRKLLLRATAALLLARANGPVLAQDQQAINDLYDRWERAFAQRDAALLVTTYTEDAVFLSGGTLPEPPRIGLEAVLAPQRALIAKDLASGSSTRFSFRVVQRLRQGDMVSDLGYYRLVLTPADPAAAPRALTGKFLVVAVRQPDGHWAARFDAASSAPPQDYDQARAVPGLKFAP